MCRYWMAYFYVDAGAPLQCEILMAVVWHKGLQSWHLHCDDCSSPCRALDAQLLVLRLSVGSAQANSSGIYSS